MLIALRTHARKAALNLRDLRRPVFALATIIGTLALLSLVVVAATLAVHGQWLMQAILGIAIIAIVSHERPIPARLIPAHYDWAREDFEHYPHSNASPLH